MSQQAMSPVSPVSPEHLSVFVPEAVQIPQIILERILLGSDFSNEKNALEKELKDRTIEWWDRFNAKFGKVYEYPNLTFEIRGEVAGRASYQAHEIRYNLELYKNNKEDFHSDTIPHEIAHLFNYRMRMAPNEYRRYRLLLKPHGKEWKMVMRMMGLNPNRCHNYKTTKARVVPRPYAYKCSCKVFHETEGMHKKLSRGIRRWCLKCKVDLVYVGLSKDHPILPKSREEVNKKLEELQKQLAILEA